MVSTSLYQIDLIQPGDLDPRAFSFWNEFSPAGMVSSSATRKDDVDTGPWHFTWFIEAQNPPYDLPAQAFITASLTGFNQIPNQIDFLISEVPNKNWLAESYQSFSPFSVDRFFLYGSHEIDSRTPKGQIGIVIDAATAFGSGEHPTTKGCLLALCDIDKMETCPRRILDLGTGSGILAIAAWKLWQCPVMAVDIDRESVRVACHYRKLNNIPKGKNGMTAKQASTPCAKTVFAAGPYDLIIANILASPLRALADDIASVSAARATLVLSGLLERQKNDVIAAYTPHGFRLVDEKIISDWAAIRLER